MVALSLFIDSCFMRITLRVVSSRDENLTTTFAVNVEIFTRDSVAIARICYGNSVCLSVCPSVRLSHGWISQKRLKLGSRNFHHTVAPSL